ncbi:MAG: hypothetical protein PV340_02180 [Wolbachia sp.]|nr:hypothetical protein [Wolbachia sp.]MDD9335955.1 hypothetical protein [Wolbachia sp.]
MICITNKVLNNMVDHKPLSKPKIDEHKKVREVKNKYSDTQNQKVINALFTGKTLVW